MATFESLERFIKAKAKFEKIWQSEYKREYIKVFVNYDVYDDEKDKWAIFMNFISEWGKNSKFNDNLFDPWKSFVIDDDCKVITEALEEFVCGLNSRNLFED